MEARNDATFSLVSNVHSVNTVAHAFRGVDGGSDILLMLIDRRSSSL